MSQTTESHLAELVFDSSHTRLVTDSSSEWYDVYRDVARRFLTYLYAVSLRDFIPIVFSLSCNIFYRIRKSTKWVKKCEV